MGHQKFRGIASALAGILVLASTTPRGAPAGPVENAPAAAPAMRKARVGAEDPVLRWNSIMLAANANDHDPGVVPSPDQKGPPRTARAFAMVHAAIYDAVNSIDPTGEPYLIHVPTRGDASIEAAVATAGYLTLSSLFPKQHAYFRRELAGSMAGLDPDRAAEGAWVGAMAAWAVLIDRLNDGSAQADGAYRPVGLPGYHQPDPLHPTQEFVSAEWGRVRPFAVAAVAPFRASGVVGTDPKSRLAWLRDPRYAAAFDEVKAVGSKAGAVRTADQTVIGIFWSYDGSPQIGTPPRQYNMVVRAVAATQGLSTPENARLLALANLAMADAAIAAWDNKYTYQLWRPIVGIRNAGSDGNPNTVADPAWEPLGAQADNGSGTNFTPPFPSYTSGHATIGSAAFQTLRRYFGRDEIAFSLRSDEFNGITRDQDGAVRPALTRHYENIAQAEKENHDSRIYLGVHWRPDQDQGTAVGRAVADSVFGRVLRPR